MEKQKKVYDGMNYDRKMEALDMLQAAMEQVETTKKAIDQFITTLGIDLKQDCEEPECCGDISLDELAVLVSEKTGYCPCIIEKILDATISILGDFDDDDDDEDN